MAAIIPEARSLDALLKAPAVRDVARMIQMKTFKQKNLYLCAGRLILPPVSILYRSPKNRCLGLPFGRLRNDIRFHLCR